MFQQTDKAEFEQAAACDDPHVQLEFKRISEWCSRLRRVFQAARQLCHFHELRDQVLLHPINWETDDSRHTNVFRTNRTFCAVEECKVILNLDVNSSSLASGQSE